MASAVSSTCVSSGAFVAIAMAGGGTVVVEAGGFVATAVGAGAVFVPTLLVASAAQLDKFVENYVARTGRIRDAEMEFAVGVLRGIEAERGAIQSPCCEHAEQTQQPPGIRRSYFWHA